MLDGSQADAHTLGLKAINWKWKYNQMSLKSNIKPIVYGVFNVAVGCGIVFANKAVLSVFNFKFVYALTLVHTIVTMIGMWIFAATGIFQIKRFNGLQV